MAYKNKTGLPSVTDIVSPFVDTRWFKKEHTDRGSAVHAAVSTNLKGLFVPMLPEGWRSYYDSFIQFRDHIEKVLFVEDRITHESDRYCGQPDCIALMDEYYGRKVALIDWKTSIAKAKWWLLQAGGYAKLAHQIDIFPEIFISARLRAPKDAGKKALVNVYDSKDLLHFQRLFENAHSLYKHFN